MARHPVKVVQDDGVVLAALIEPDTPLTFPAHPFGRHPWSGASTWRGASVLQLHRALDWYSVWKVFNGQELLHWHINFDEQVRRRTDGIDVNDLQLDLLVEPDGSSRWKYVEHLAPALANGRMNAEQLSAVLQAATDVAEALQHDDRWWNAWDDWTPANGPASWRPCPTSTLPKAGSEYPRSPVDGLRCWRRSDREPTMSLSGCE